MDNFGCSQRDRGQWIFRDEAAGRMTKTKIKELTMSPDYRGREAALRDIYGKKIKLIFPNYSNKPKRTGTLSCLPARTHSAILT